MNKKLTWGTVFLFSLCLLMFSACSDDDDHAPAGPIINLTEIGHGNNKTGIVGKDLHLEGTIVADGIVRRIDIEIHPENGDGFMSISIFRQKLLRVIITCIFPLRISRDK